jgi:nitrilase
LVDVGDPDAGNVSSAPTVRVAAVQAAYVLMNREATLERVSELTAKAAAESAELVVFPEVFVPGTPIWIDTQPIWDGDEKWFRLLADNAISVPSDSTERLGGIAREHGVWLVVGVDERETHGGTIYNTVLYFSPAGLLAGRHRKLVPTGAERTVWGMGDGSTLRAVDTPFGRIGGLTCWENYMPLARFHMYAQGIDIWLAPTLAAGDGWIATLQHIARENRSFVVGVNPVLHVDLVPADFPDRDRLLPAAFIADNGPWVEPGNTAIVAPSGVLLAGPVRDREEILIVDLDLGEVRSARRHLDPVGHYNRPDVFRLYVDTSPRPAVIERAAPVESPDLVLGANTVVIPAERADTEVH